jgi:primosomal protein N' (replication factor Y)
MIHLLYDGRVEAAVEGRIEDAVRALTPAARRAGVEILGPAPMFLSRLKGRYRWHITLKGPQSDPLHRLAGLAIDRPAPAGTGGVRLHIDVDPIHTL